MDLIMQKKQEVELANQESLSQPPKLKFFKPHPLEEELIKALPTLIQHYDGKPVDTQALAAFQQDGMKYYTDFKTYQSTDIGITLKLDISKKAKIYRQHYAQEPGASFSLYLMWTLVQAMQSIPGFNFRYIGGRWYEFNNLPLFTTLTIEGELNNFVFPNIVGSSWSDLCQLYLSAKNKTSDTTQTNTYSYPIYAIATHITNLGLPFTSMSIPTPKKGIEIERPMFILGERTEKKDKLIMPFHAKLPHASLHPGLFQQLLSNWAKSEESLADSLGMVSRL
jgi:chloramphenicol O-acetyltransferase type A